MARPIDTEVAILGGGTVGMTLALALARAGIGVAVADRAAPGSVLAPVHDGRASAIALASQRLMRGIGVWEDVEDDAQPIFDIRVSDGDAPSFLHYDHRSLGGEPFGAMVENRHLRAAMHRAARREGIRLVAPAAVTGLTVERSGVRVALAGGRALRARLAVAADGGRSEVRGMAGIRTRGRRYPQTGIVLTVAHARPHAGIAHERFLAAGPFAILPLKGNRSSLVWTERTGLAAAVLALDEKRFAEEVAVRFGDFLGSIEAEGPRWSYPLCLHQTESYFAERVALAGDAAHVLHPIAGQGLNLGLRDAAALAEVVVDAARLGLDPGGPQVLTRYQRWRRLDALALVAVTDSLNRLFSNDLAPLRAARDFGLAIVDRMPAVKRVLVNHARGTAGKLPRLLAGDAL